MRCFWLFLSVICLVSGCSFKPNGSFPPVPTPDSFPRPPDSQTAEGISEVSLGGSTGLLGSAFKIVLRSDGSALLECTFYKLDQAGDSQVKYAEQHCGEMYRRRSSDFAKVEPMSGDVRLKAVFTGSLPKERFEELVRLVVKNDFFSMNDRYMKSGLTDSPADSTIVIYTDKTKEVADNSVAGPEKLYEIKRMIYALAGKTEWMSRKQQR